jgi:hypothetical protein
VPVLAGVIGRVWSLYVEDFGPLLSTLAPAASSSPVEYFRPCYLPERRPKGLEKEEIYESLYARPFWYLMRSYGYLEGHHSCVFDSVQCNSVRCNERAYDREKTTR